MSRKLLKVQGVTSRQCAFLALLVASTSGLSFLMRASRNNGTAPYLVSTSIFLAEALKCVIGLGFEFRSIYIEDRAPPTYEAIHDTESKEYLERCRYPTAEDTVRMRISNLSERIITPDAWKLAIPGALYVCQNLLLLFAIKYISAATYQAANQFKVLSASLLSLWLLNRRYTNRQWASICALCFGIVIMTSEKGYIQKLFYHDQKDLSSPMSQSAKHLLMDEVIEHGAVMGGILTVIIACTVGSGGAVLMEKVMKDDKVSIWTRNVQLAFWGMLPAAFAIFWHSAKFGAFDPLQNFGTLAWCTVVARAFAGLLVSYVLQQCDAVLKGIATSIALIFSYIIETTLLDEQFSFSASSGAAIVAFSSYTYIKQAR